MASDLMNESELVLQSGKSVKFIYTNYNGETASRITIVSKVFFGSSAYHPESKKKPQWFLRGYDMAKKDWRDYSLDDIKVIE